MPIRPIFYKNAFSRLHFSLIFLLMTGAFSNTLAFDRVQNNSPLAYYRNYSNPVLISLQSINPSELYAKEATDKSYYSLFFDGEDGNLRRSFDPQGKVDQSYTAGGSKHLGRRNLFSGSFSYHRQTLTEKMWVHNSNPYASLPFLLADSSTGDFHLNGLYWEVTYAREWIPGKLYSGTTLFYNVDEEYKTVFPKPQINHRDIVLTQGFRFQPGERFGLGLRALYFDFQENMETSQYNQDQTKTPIFYKIRGLDNPLIFKGETSEERLMATQGYQLINDGQAPFLKNLMLNWSGGYEKAQCQNTDGGAYPVAQGKWSSHTEFFQTDLTIGIHSAFSINLFAEGNRRAVSARHPSIDMKIYTARLQQIEIGVNPRLIGRIFTYGGKYSYLSQTYRQTDNYNGILHYYPNELHSFELNLKTTGKDKIGAGLDYGYDRLIGGNSQYYYERTEWFYALITQADAVYYAGDKNQLWAQIHFHLKSRSKHEYAIFIKYGYLNSDDFESGSARRSFLTTRLLIEKY